MERSIYMTTGEFAKMVGVTKDTLFHYDDINLFSPEIVGENGYRYYSINQAETLDTILILKDLGMPLKEIREFIKNRNADRFIELFTEREQQIDKEIFKLQSMKEWIAQRRQKIEIAAKTDYMDVSVGTFQDRYYLFRKVSGDFEKEFYKKMSELVYEFQTTGAKCNYEVAYIQYGEMVENNIYDRYDNIILLFERNMQNLECKKMPGGNYITAYHKGHWDSIGEAYERLIKYKETNRLKTDDIYIERYVVDNFTTDDVNEYVTEITVRIIDNF